MGQLKQGSSGRTRSALLKSSKAQWAKSTKLEDFANAESTALVKGCLGIPSKRLQR